MSLKNTPIHNVKTNIITGFLGVGKTTAIISLLNQRTPKERWSVLVNEYGDMGIDGHLMENNDASIMIMQVPGGCICCAAGLPLQVAVNQLLKRTHPHRLIIEPSGMGHPRKILKSLTGRHYKSVLDMRACVCLLDPRKLNDKRYLESDLFVDQIDVADIVIANKIDLCEKGELNNFRKYILKRGGAKQTHYVSDGNIKLKWLNLNNTALNRNAKQSQSEFVGFDNNSIPTNSKLELRFKKITIDYPSEIKFSYHEIIKYIASLKAERIKGIINTDKGFTIINSVDGSLKTELSNSQTINRIEIISTNNLKKDVIKNTCFHFILR